MVKFTLRRPEAAQFTLGPDSTETLDEFLDRHRRGPLWVECYVVEQGSGAIGQKVLVRSDDIGVVWEE